MLLALAVVVVLGTVVGRTFYGQRPVEVRQLGGATMGTTWTLKIALPAGAPAAWVDAIGDTVQSRLDRIDSLMSTWDSTSELSRFNHSPDTSAVPLSPETMAVLAVARDVSVSSDGALDITVGPLVTAWGFGAGGADEPRPPPDAILDSLRKVVGFDRIRVDTRRGLAAKAHPGVTLDLSAVAKGYALDLAAEGVHRMGGSDFVLEVGVKFARMAGGPMGRPGAWRSRPRLPDRERSSVCSSSTIKRSPPRATTATTSRSRGPATAISWIPVPGFPYPGAVSR